MGLQRTSNTVYPPNRTHSHARPHIRFWVPAGLVFFVAFNREPIHWVILFALFLLLSLHPIPRLEAAVHSRLNRVLFRYFSLRMVRTVCSYC